MSNSINWEVKHWINFVSQQVIVDVTFDRTKYKMLINHQKFGVITVGINFSLKFT